MLTTVPEKILKKEIVYLVFDSISGFRDEKPGIEAFQDEEVLKDPGIYMIAEEDVSLKQHQRGA